MSNDLRIRLRQPQMLRIALQPGNFLVTPEISIGTVTTLSPNQPVSVVVTGTVKQPVLNFGIPKGDPGDATIDDTAGSGATTKVWSADKAYGEIDTVKATLENDVGDLKSAITSDEIKALLQEENILGTTQTITFDSVGNVQSITHKDGSNNTIRTDAFTFATNSITEVRTLSTGESLTIVTDLTTLATTVTYAAA